MARVGKRVSGRIRSNPVVDTQGGRMWATCLGYSTPYLQSRSELQVRTIRNFNIEEEEECTTTHPSLTSV